MSEIPTLAVKAIILNDANEVLLLQRNPETRDGDQWDLPGGLIDLEDLSEEGALKRELREELGVEAEIGKFVGEWQFFRPKDQQIVRVRNYVATVLRGKLVLSDEHIDKRWVNTNKTRELTFKDDSLHTALEDLQIG